MIYLFLNRNQVIFYLPFIEGCLSGIERDADRRKTTKK